MLERLLHLLLVIDEVGVSDDDTTRRTRRPRRVLEHRDRIRGDPERRRGDPRVWPFLDVQALDPAERRALLDIPLELRELRARREDPASAGVFGDPRQDIDRAFAVRRAGGNRHHTRIQATKKRDDELDTLRVEQDGGVTAVVGSEHQQAPRGSTCSASQVAERDAGLLDLTLAQEPVSDPIGKTARPLLERIDQGERAVARHFSDQWATPSA